ncbi:hypothetical protein JD844_013764 [Phrynosoma platyrhinos]|uniref:Uncharacterized protein n=1 Tax=Phrynosoma platyrhinos TaxID=52577 RepID=A0ABQ7TM36_PHRPL|nr:hypothetical protein JD844_013764 [Phrynosoma platyrhinos]
MATELRSGGVVSFSFQNVPEHGVNADRNMAEEAHAKTVDAEGERITPRVIQVGTIGEFLGWVAPQDLVQGSEEGLAQRWETQWQEVLKAMQPLPIECGIQQPSKTLPWDLSEVATDGNQWPNGEVVAQFLVDNSATFQGPDLGGNGAAVKEAEVVVVSPEMDWTPLRSGLSRPVQRETQLFNGQELRSSGMVEDALFLGLEVTMVLKSGQCVA